LSATYTGGGGTASGAAGSGSGGINIHGGGGGGGLGGNANAGGNRNYMGGHGGAPIILNSGWAINSSGTRPYVCGGGGGGGRETPINTSGASTGGAGGYTYLDDGTIQYNIYSGSQHPETLWGAGFFTARGGPNRQQSDTIRYYYGDSPIYYGFGGCGGAAGTTLDNGTGLDTARSGGFGGNALIIARYL